MGRGDRLVILRLHGCPPGRDWCVSRQLWWGHQIPAYLVVEDHAQVGRKKHPEGRVWRKAPSPGVRAPQCQALLLPGNVLHAVVTYPSVRSKLPEVAFLYLTTGGTWPL